MKNRIRLVTILKNVLFLTCLFIVLTASKCGNEREVCEVVINSPATGTIFSENDNISFSASLELSGWNDEDDKRYDDLGGVRWISDIDGIISFEDYSPAKKTADHSFSTDRLTLGIHTIKCYAVDYNYLGGIGEDTCVDEISIKIDEEDDDDDNGNGVLQGNWNLLSIEDVPENYTYSGSWEFKSDDTYHWVFWMKDEVNNYIYNYDGNGTYLLSDDKLSVTGIVAETVIEGTPEDYMIIDYGQDNSSGSVVEYFSFPDDEGDEWLYTR